MSDQPADPAVEPDGNQDENTNGVPEGDDAGEDDLRNSADAVERLQDHNRSFDDTAGVNPDRGQQELRPDAR